MCLKIAVLYNHTVIKEMCAGFVKFVWMRLVALGRPSLFFTHAQALLIVLPLK